jgi:hypothetical protein
MPNKSKQSEQAQASDSLPNGTVECSADKLLEVCALVLEALKQARTNKSFLNNLGVLVRKNNGYYDTDTTITY